MMKVSRMEWLDMRDAFCAVLLLGLISIRRRRRNLQPIGPLTVGAEYVAFLEPQGGRVQLGHPTWTDRLAESPGAILIESLIKDTRSHPRYVTMCARSVQQRGLSV
jgi:hypothetical protein